MFILATTELQKVPATILSRCQRHSFRRIDAPQIAGYLEYIAQQEHFALSHDAAGLIARLAEGGVRDALSLLDQCSAFEKIDVEAVYSAMGLAGNRRIIDMLEHILRHDAAAALEEFTALWMDGKDPATFIRELSGLMRDILIQLVAPQSASSLVSGGYDPAALTSFAGRMTREELICAMETVQRYAAQLREAKNPKTVVELCLISLCDSTTGEDINSLRARVSRLEAAGAGVGAYVPAAPVQTEKAAPASAAVINSLPAEAYPPPPPPAEEYPAALAAQEDEMPPMPSDDDAPFAPPADNETAEYAPPEEAISPADEALWQGVCERVKAKLSPDLRIVLEDTAKVRGAVEGGVLRLECLPGFVYGRFNRQETLDRFAAAAKQVTGREMRVILSELKDDSGGKRSVDELKQFKEVRFI